MTALKHLAIFVKHLAIFVAVLAGARRTSRNCRNYFGARIQLRPIKLALEAA
jgi:hypothetical protein